MVFILDGLQDVRFGIWSLGGEGAKGNRMKGLKSHERNLVAHSIDARAALEGRPEIIARLKIIHDEILQNNNTEMVCCIG